MLAVTKKSRRSPTPSLSRRLSHGDRGFESISLHRRVHCEPEFLTFGETRLGRWLAAFTRAYDALLGADLARKPEASPCLFLCDRIHPATHITEILPMRSDRRRAA